MGTRSLRRDEAEARTALVAIGSYHLDLDLRPEPASGFTSRSTVRFRATAGATTFADVAPVSIRSATLNGRPLPAAVDGRLVLEDLAADNELVVDAVMAYSHDGEGLHRHVDPADGRAYVYAMSFLDAAPRWFACFDQPDLKAPVAMSVRCPDDWIVAGNGPATRISAGHWQLAATHPLATYFTTLVAGPYHSVRRTHDGIEFVLHARESLAADLDRDADELFAHSFRFVDELHRLFGVRYPWGEYHQAFVPDFNAGAMENPGCVTFRDQLIFRDRPTPAQRHVRASTIAHEMAHMWFGDLVTMRWWDDLWLNESFAEYLGYRVCAATGLDGAWADFGIDRKPWGHVADRRPSTHPVAGNAAGDAAAALSEFDGISYSKGASVLRQLAARLGDDVLLDGLRRHFAAHRFGNATFADLIASFTAAGADDLEGWAQRWLRTTGLDTVRVTPASGGSVVTGGTRPHSVAVAAFAADGTELSRERIVLDGPVTVVHPPAALVLADAADETWAKLAIGDWAAVPALLPRLDPLARVAVWNALRLAAADAEVAPATILDVLACVVGESDAVLNRTLTWAAVTVAGTYVADPAKAAVCARLAEIAATALGTAEPGDGRQLAAARAWISTTTDVTRLRAWLGGTLPRGLVADRDLRWRLLRRLATLDAVGVAEIDAAEADDRSSTGVEQATRCRTLRPDAAAKAAAWQRLMTDADCSNYELYAIADSFWQPLQGELTAPYVERYFDEIPGTAALRSGWLVGRLAGYAFPSTAVDTSTLALADAFLTRDDLGTTVRRAVVDEADDLRRAVAVRARFPG